MGMRANLHKAASVVLSIQSAFSKWYHWDYSIKLKKLGIYSQNRLKYSPPFISIITEAKLLWASLYSSENGDELWHYWGVVWNLMRHFEAYITSMAHSMYSIHISYYVIFISAASLFLLLGIPFVIIHMLSSFPLSSPYLPSSNSIYQWWL